MTHDAEQIFCRGMTLEIEERRERLFNKVNIAKKRSRFDASLSDPTDDSLSTEREKDGRRDERNTREERTRKGS